jgi:hypothetical protein
VKRCDWAWLRDAFRLRWTMDTLEVFQDNDERFKLDFAGGFTLDLKQKVAKRNDRVLATFAQIESFVVEIRENSDVGDSWKLILARNGRWDIEIGRTKDQLQCARLAARMSTLTGKPVVARKGGI